MTSEMAQTTDSDVQAATQLPEPKGYHILCAIPDIEDKYESGLYKTENKFPTGPWCEAGDFVLVRPHTGTRLHIHGKSFRIINDDSVEAVVEDPRGIQRA